MTRGGLLMKETGNDQTANEQMGLMKQLNRELHEMIRNLEYEDKYLTDLRRINFTDFLKNKLLIVLIIRNGVPYTFFSLIKELTPFSLNDWADYLDISSKTMIRYQNQDKSFKPIHAEKIIELAEVTILGQEVFGDNDKFRLWLETPNFALGNLKPFDLLRDSYGKELLIGELVRIEHGILA